MARMYVGRVGADLTMREEQSGSWHELDYGRPHFMKRQR